MFGTERTETDFWDKSPWYGLGLRGIHDIAGNEARIDDLENVLGPRVDRLDSWTLRPIAYVSVLWKGSSGAPSWSCVGQNVQAVTNLKTTLNVDAPATDVYDGVMEITLVSGILGAKHVILQPRKNASAGLQDLNEFGVSRSAYTTSGGERRNYVIDLYDVTFDVVLQAFKIKVNTHHMAASAGDSFLLWGSFDMIVFGNQDYFAAGTNPHPGDGSPAIPDA